MPYSMQYNFTIEHQFTRNLVARGSYVGTQGRDLQAFQEIDPATYAANATTSNINARRPLAPNFASMIKMTNGGFSNYNAFQFTVEHRLSQGLSFVANYTFSKALARHDKTALEDTLNKISKTCNNCHHFFRLDIKDAPEK